MIKGDGSDHEVLNTLVCNGWTSSAGATELMYDYFYKTSPNSTEYLFQYTRDALIGHIRLPLGLKEYNYTLYLKAVISDKLGRKSEAMFEYQVRLGCAVIIAWSCRFRRRAIKKKEISFDSRAHETTSYTGYSDSNKGISWSQIMSTEPPVSCAKSPLAARLEGIFVLC